MEEWIQEKKFKISDAYAVLMILELLLL